MGNSSTCCLTSEMAVTATDLMNEASEVFLGGPKGTKKKDGVDLWNLDPSVMKLKDDDGKGWFKVTIDKSRGDKLGVDVDPAPNDVALIIVGFTGGGLVEKWNREHPNQALKIGDRIHVVNGIRGDVHKLVAACRKDAILELTVETGTGDDFLFPRSACHGRVGACLVPCTGLSRFS
mmetsp:Transcript_401/g.1052  ORF Transcript_401/g.1052 Transcript_401/m.1052 type:complete len:177 (-) Transcript_401:142-672(-)